MLSKVFRPASGSSNALRAFATYPNHSNQVRAPKQATNGPIKNVDIDKMYGPNSKLKPRNVPIQLRQTGDNGDGGMLGEGSRFLVDTRLRKGPYFHLSEEAGAWCFSVYNKIYHPRAYISNEEGGIMEEYKYLTEHVTMWNVAVERQICVKGPDAGKMVDYVCTRKPTKICPTGKCKYVILCNQEGGILNDPILLRVQDDEWWFSIADSDLNLWLQGVNHDGKFDCTVKEIDVAPVQIQGPKSTALMADVFGPRINDMKFYDCIHAEVAGCPVVISASGFSAEKGYEIYLQDATINAEKMWYAMLEAGKKHNLKVIAPGHHRRIEAGMMSYGADIDIEVNPYECGFGWQVDLDREDFIGKKALAAIKKEGVTHKLAGLRIGGKPISWYIADFYHVMYKGELVGYVTSAWWSPEQNSNVALAMLPAEYTQYGQDLEVALPTMYSDNPTEYAVVEKTPFKAPAKGWEGRAMNVQGTKV